ncbi:site-specific DNA-methyltransferase (adenine-specific) [Breoghania corrubedonensis]|uniref:Methyltransferase n=1 Tax=Breoghania corrubedonensis TaxID=665038 RepID=A0A2T5VCD7_9HYPH|nr:DNA methyltransferase [Breoghania corrubedonensis]PTW61421.1 site-specific DNA-methyltransferase (adenine-specific) [Breoghania corrubedonensis]
MKWQLHNVDAIPWLIDQSSDNFDALVTDPPYSSGGLHTGTRTADSPNGKYLNDPGKYPEFTGENRDQFSYMQWSTLWMTHAHRVLRAGAPVMVFSDWRQLPVLTSALQAAGFTWRGIVAWDKTEGVRPQKGRFRQQAEFVCWGSKGKWHSSDGPVLPGVFRYSVAAGGPKLHTTGKPVPLMADLVKACPSGSVLDPFAGSGSTGVAVIRSGRFFVGCEREEAYFNVACDRLSEIA